MENRHNLLSSASGHQLKTLQYQIEGLLPIRHSYNDLQNYHLKISREFQIILQDHQQISEYQIQKLKQQNLYISQLDKQRQFLRQKLKELENTQAKLKMQRKNLLALSETITCKENLQIQQKNIRKNRRQQLIQSKAKMIVSLQSAKKTNLQLQHSIKEKYNKNKSLQQEIQRRNNFNIRLQNNIQAFETNIKIIAHEIENNNARNKSIDKQINQFEKQIQKTQKNNFEYNQHIIKKSEQINKLKNQIQYYLKLLQNQNSSHLNMLNNQQRLLKINNIQKNTLVNLQSQIQSINLQVNSQNQSFCINKNLKLAVENHLFNLKETNALIIKNMQNWHQQDLSTIQIIQSKTRKLKRAVQKNKSVIDDYQNVLVQKYINGQQKDKKEKNLKIKKNYTSKELQNKI